MFDFLIKQLNKYSLSIYFTLYSYIYKVLYTYCLHILCIFRPPITSHTFGTCVRESCCIPAFAISVWKCKTVSSLCYIYMFIQYRLSLCTPDVLRSDVLRIIQLHTAYTIVILYFEFNIPVSTRHDRILPGSCSRYPRLVQTQSSLISS